MKSHLLLPLACLLLPLASPAAPALRSELLVSTAWLAEHLSDTNLVVLHVSRDRNAYQRGHIPGARYLALSDFVITNGAVQNELPPVDQLRQAFEQVGISDSSRVVLYTEASVLPATRAYFTLDYLGHGDHVALLDGGLRKWIAESRPITTEPVTAQPGRLTVRPRPEIVVNTEEVRDLSRAAVNDPARAAVLLDVRGREQLRERGYIPGALNRPWMENEIGRENSALREEAELRKLYESLGLTSDRSVVTYCGSGMQATQTYFTLKYLGYRDVRMYDGSFSEWIKANGPVAK